LLLSIAPGSSSAVIDPFYRNRMENGFRAFDQGNWEQAAHQLRIACFGYLDEPVALVEGLMRLAVVEVTLGDEDAFRRIFARMVELEERFTAYSAAQAPQSVRRQFEDLAARLVPAQSLRASPGFRSISQRAEIQRLAEIPPAQRRTELEARLEAEPGRPDWLLEMARLELTVRRPVLALDWLDQLPTDAAEIPPATCLRQQAASESNDCERMDLSRPFCPNVPAAVVEFRLECLVEAGRWTDAADLLGGLEPELRLRRRIVRLERRLQKEMEPAVTDESAVETEPEPADTPDVVVEMPTPSPLPPVAETRHSEARADPTELGRLRLRLAASATGEQLDALMTDAEGFAASHPSSREARLLVAEIAYLRSDWPRAVQHFRQAGELRPDEAHLAFYQAVALYESGEPVAAAEVLRPVVSRLERTSFVNDYVDRILAPGI
jgi:hypothetical protein